MAFRAIGVRRTRCAFANVMRQINVPDLIYGDQDWSRQEERRRTVMWPVAWRILMRMYDIRPGAAAESRARLETELEWLDGRLADGRTYLAGDRFNRADLTVARLLANFAEKRTESSLHLNS